MRTDWFRKRRDIGEIEDVNPRTQEKEERNQEENRIVRFLLRACVVLALLDVICYVVFAYTHSLAAFTTVGFLMALAGCYIWCHF